MSKTYRLQESELQPISQGHGMAIATSRVTVDGQIVGHMYREAPAFEGDSGWRFTAGTETEQYGQNADNWDIVDVNLVANLDRDIVPFLDQPVGAAFVRWPLGAPLRPAVEHAQPSAEGSDAAAASADHGAAPASIDDNLPDPDAPPQAPQHQALNRDWWIGLPGSFSGFMSNGALQLVSVNKPPRRVWVDIRNAPEPQPGAAALMVKDIRLAARPSGSVELNEPGTDPGEHRIGFWYEEHREGERGYWTLYTYTIRDASFVQAAFLSTSPNADWALSAWRSLRYRPGTGQEWATSTPDDE